MVASGEIIPLSNYGDRGPAPVASYQGTSRYGVFDMAGNAREWTLNASDRSDHHFILGGGWNDDSYSFNNAYTQNAFDDCESCGVTLHAQWQALTVPVARSSLLPGNESLRGFRHGGQRSRVDVKRQRSKRPSFHSRRRLERRQLFLQQCLHPKRLR